jgi:integrase
MVTDVVRCPNTLKESKGRVTYYSEDEVQRMLTASLQLPNIDKQEVHDVVLMAAKTGARQGELLKLKWTDVYFDEGVVVFRDTKTDEDRELPLTTSVREMLEKRYASRIDDGEVFLIGKDSLLRRLRAVQKAAGIDGKDKCFHTLRHTAATTMFAKGASLPEVQAVLGHSQASTTLRYSHATQEGKRKALNYLD